MLEALSKTLSAYDAYKNGSFFLMIGFAAILYLWIMEDKKGILMVLAAVPSVIMALFLFPAFAFVASNYFLEGGVYYRILWLIPLSMITAYAFTRTISRLGDRKKRLVTMGLFTVLIVGAGQLVYLNPLISPSQNPYQLPQSVINAADIMHVEGRDVKAALPAEMLQFIRQYDPSIQLAYGRDALVDGWGSNNLHDALEEPFIRSYAITDAAKAQFVDYIVIRTGTTVVGTNPIEQYEFTFIAETDGYDIYIFDRSEFADEKKKVYLPLVDPDRDNCFVEGATGPDSEFKYIPQE